MLEAKDIWVFLLYQEWAMQESKLLDIEAYGRELLVSAMDSTSMEWTTGKPELKGKQQNVSLLIQELH